MPKFLVIGATGYIGAPLAASLVANDNVVYGLARSAEKARSLAAKEIIPVHGSVEDSAAYLAFIRSSNIDVVIDVAGSNDGTFKILEDIKRVAAERIRQNTEAGIKNGPKLGFIYCSGTWVHGSSTRRKFNDLDQVGVSHSVLQPPKLVAWRTALERKILDASDVLDVMIVRPSLVWGLPIDPKSRPGLIHVDDVVSGFVCAAEKLPLIAGTGVYPIFDLWTGQESMTDIIAEAAHVLDYKGQISYDGTGDNLFAEAMCVSANVDSNRAKQLLGWIPKRLGGFVCTMDVAAKAFEAAHHYRTT